MVDFIRMKTFTHPEVDTKPRTSKSKKNSETVSNLSFQSILYSLCFVIPRFFSLPTALLNLDSLTTK